MTEPTDAELGQLAEECGIGWAAGLGGMDDFLRTFTRAVLAKWGTPPAVVGDPEVYQYQSEDGTWHEFLDHRHYNNTVADGRWPIRALYTTPQPTQAQAGAVPLTDEQIDAAAKKLAECMEYPWEFMPEPGRKNMRKHAQDVIGAAYPLGGKP